ncbi:MAG: hypothetical protein ACI9F9_000695 [Candidatus Paceibacteria bacterium]|jgi:hypothetical protein
MQITTQSIAHLLLISFVLASASLAQDQESERTLGLLQHGDQAHDGYTLLAPLGSTETFLIDMEGEIVHVWGSEYAPSGPVYLRDNGNLLRPARHESNTRFQGGGIGGRIQEFSWDSELLWDYVIMDDKQTQHHDIALMPNGNLLLIVWKHHTAEEALAAGRDPAVVMPGGLWTDSIVEIRPIFPDAAQIVWQWNSWDHLIQDLDEEKMGYGSIPDNAGRIDINGDFRDMPPMTQAEREELKELERQMAALGYAGGGEEDDEESADADSERGKITDWLHTNAVNYNAVNDLIVVSTPHMNEIWVIDHSTSTEEAASSRGGRWKQGGDLLYRWGNPRNYGAGNNEDKRLFYQHDPSWLPAAASGELRLLLYNNGRGRPTGDFSTAVELTLPFDPTRGFVREPLEAFAPQEPTWEWGGLDVLYSAFISGAQRLPNGNTLICEGASGRLVEVTMEGDVAWEYVNECFGEAAPKSTISPSTQPGALFRATRIPLGSPALQGSGLDSNN